MMDIPSLVALQTQTTKYTGAQRQKNTSCIAGKILQLEAVSEKMDATPGRPETTIERKASAFMMLSPILVMTLHQQLLGGKEASPIDTNAFMKLMQTWLASGLSQ